MPRLLDLFCGAGGAGEGYRRAGWEVVGVDIRPQPRYPMGFVQADALNYLALHWTEFHAFHASPPCQAYSRAKFIPNAIAGHPCMLPAVRTALIATGRPWIIENVDGAPMMAPAIRLCGLMFGLKVFRHRWFECSHLLLAPSHIPHGQRRIGKDGMMCCVGHGGGVSGRMRAQMKLFRNGQGSDTKAEWVEAMGIDWMTRNEMSQAIPPAYTDFVGKQLLRLILP